MKPFGVEKRRAVFAKTGGWCFYCGLPLKPDRGSTFDAHGRDWLVPQHNQFGCADHKVPSQRGGSDDLENLNPSCGSCNSRKGLSTVDEFRFRLGLQAGRLPYIFSFDQPLDVERDYIVVVSLNFARGMILHNFPQSYGHKPRGRPPFKQ